MAQQIYVESKPQSEILNQSQTETLLRKSFEDTESCTDLSTSDGSRNIDEGGSSRTRKVLEQIKCRRRSVLVVLAAVVIICTGIIILLRLMGIIGAKDNRVMNLLTIEGDDSIHYSNDPQPDGILTNKTTFCGNTARIARERGCVFDVMSFAWLPASCIDFEMMDRYISERTWEWYADYDLKHKLPLSVVRQGEYKWAFSSQSYHIAHCIYTWEKQGRFLFAPSREEEKWIDQGSFGRHHTTHCIDFILKRGLEPNKISTIWNGVAECDLADTMGTL